MSARSLFSYVENVTAGCLVLDNPFLVDAAAGLVCRYDLGKAEPSDLSPLSQLTGVAAWERLLPVEAAAGLTAEAVLALAPWREDDQLVCPVHRVSFRHGLIFDVALPLARAYDCPGIRLAGRDWEVDALRGHPAAGDLPQLVGTGSGGEMGPADYYDVGCWGNPFRLEGLKLIGLELAMRHHRAMPTLVVHDPAGELVFALSLAGRHHHDVNGDFPYRVVLVQERPEDRLCRRFEGGAHGEAEGDVQTTQAIAPPELIAADICNFLTRCGGTAISLAAATHCDHVFTTAVDLLQRTGFVDDEDEVYLLSAAHPNGRW